VPAPHPPTSGCRPMSSSDGPARPPWHSAAGWRRMSMSVSMMWKLVTMMPRKRPGRRWRSNPRSEVLEHVFPRRIPRRVGIRPFGECGREGIITGSSARCVLSNSFRRLWSLFLFLLWEVTDPRFHILHPRHRQPPTERPICGQHSKSAPISAGSIGHLVLPSQRRIGHTSRVHVGGRQTSPVGR